PAGEVSPVLDGRPRNVGFLPQLCIHCDLPLHCGHRSSSPCAVSLPRLFIIHTGSPCWTTSCTQASFFPTVQSPRLIGTRFCEPGVLSWIHSRTWLRFSIEPMTATRSSVMALSRVSSDNGLPVAALSFTPV